MKFQYNVDADRVHIVGFSNGGFMAHRMACEHADALASIASFAGPTFLDPMDCQPTEPVSVVHIHGTSDTAVGFFGGSFSGSPAYPGAIATVEQWATKNGCGLIPDTSAPNIDLTAYLPGEDTTVTRYPDSCNPGGSAELWTIVDGTHSLNFSATFSRQVVEFFYAHPNAAPVVPTLKPLGIVILLSLLGATAYWRLHESTPAS